MPRINAFRPETRARERKPQPWERSLSRLAYIRMLECCVCGMCPAEAAHIRIGTDGATGRKPSDCWSIPLCALCHRLNPDSQHAGERSFWERLGCGVPHELAKTLTTYARKQDIEGGLRVVRNFRWKLNR